MSDSNAIVQHQETDLERVKSYILSPEVKERFSDMMGANGIYYLNQVMILVANSTKLQECEPKSILIAAMRAASLKLSVDPSSGQAWIIPYKGKATFQLGYKGVYELAQRTNLYRFINVIDVYEGEEVVEDRMTGMHSIAGAKKAANSKVIGRMLYFELFSGFKKTFYMTCDEIDKHAAKYSQGYQQSSSKWHDPTERPKMERKTVLVNGLRKWGRFNPGDAETLDQIEENQGFMERVNELPEEDDVSDRVIEVHTETENMAALGFGGEQKQATVTYSTQSERVTTTSDAQTDAPPPAPSTAAHSAQPANGNNTKVIEWLKQAGLADNDFSAGGMITLFGKDMTNADNKKQFMTWARNYRDWRTAGADSKAAAENAHAGTNPNA